MKQIAAVLLVIAGVGGIALGLLFAIGADGQLHRYAIAAGALALGAVCIGLGVRWVRQAERRRPESIRAEILGLARRRSGELSETDLMAALGSRWPLALALLEQLLAQGVCVKRVVGDADYYVFEDLLPRLAVRRCEFCGSGLPLDEALASCPNCGGSVQLGVQRVSLSKGDAYHMDE
jgi:hypothetical protein